MAVTICSQCPNPRYGRSRLCRQCLRPIQAAMMREHRKRNNEANVCRDCGSPRDTIHGHCLKCLKRHRRLTKEFKQRNKLKCFEAYGGPQCSCCGETTIEFLTIDHLNDNGAEHRREIGMEGQGGHRFYGWLKKHNYPPGYQVLCHNCQWGKRLCGVCPHVKKRRKSLR